jgi:Protein of unknown function (DUF1592)/Protein of unknown function (DUF1588)/Protein of unknown function (DUF1587)/Protein of unknown function (DUF1595)
MRLTHAQWEQTVQDLLKLPAPSGLSAAFPRDPAPRKDRFGSDAQARVMTQTLWAEYQRAAEALAQQVVASPALTDALLPAAAKFGDPSTRVVEFLRVFLPRAFRRPLSAATEARFMAIADKAVALEPAADPFTTRLRAVLAAALQAPTFLHRIEGGGAVVTAGRAPLEGYELASKLSYALWGTMPDDALFEAAKTGKLDTPAGRKPIIAAMVSDARANGVLRNFHRELYGVNSYQGINRTTDKFPNYYPDFGRDAQQDVLRTIDAVVVDAPGGVKDLYSSTTAFMTGKLARVYGVNPASLVGYTGDDSVSLPTKFSAGEREGLLMHAGVLGWLGHSKDPATIERGAYLARKILCIPLGSPPPAAAGVDPSQSNAKTNRQRVEAVTATCGNGCHSGPSGSINPLGFAFENYDSLGGYRTQDNGETIDATGTVEGVGSFKSGLELTRVIATSPRAHACYAAHWVAFLTDTDEPKATPKWLSKIVGLSLRGASARAIVAEIAQTDAFLTTSR